MRIEEYLINLPVVKKYAEKYSAPLLRYETHLPEPYFTKWLAMPETTIEDLAYYYLGVKGVKSYAFPGIVAGIYRHNKRDFFSETKLEQYGISTCEYWERWVTDNFLALMDAPKRFRYGGKTKPAF